MRPCMTTTDGFARTWTAWRLAGVRSGCGTSTHCGRCTSHCGCTSTHCGWRLIRSATQRSRACCGHADDGDNNNNYHLTSTCINRENQNFTCVVKTARKLQETNRPHAVRIGHHYLKPKLNCTDLFFSLLFLGFHFYSAAIRPYAVN